MKISTFLSALFLTLMLSCKSPTAQFYPTANLSTAWTAKKLYETMHVILLRETKVAKFAFGFLHTEYHSFLFAISISPTIYEYSYYNPDLQVVWSVNSNHLVSENAILNFTVDGELFLQDGDGSIVWTTNTAGKHVAGMNLTDTGNLVLFNDQNMAVWQSFDHPTDCWLPGQKLFTSQKLKSSVSLSDTTGQESMYSLQVTNKGLVANVESNPPQSYYRKWVIGYNKQRYIRSSDWSMSFLTNFSERGDPVVATYITQVSTAQYMKLMPDGHLQVFEWKSRGWIVVADLTADDKLEECDYPLVCGRNSICKSNQQCSCPEQKYFRSVNDRKANLGCSAITPLTCNSTQDQDFIIVKNVKYFTTTFDMEGVSMETCKQACLNNCSCKAAFFQYFSNASHGECFLLSEIFTMKSVDSEQFYLKSLALIKVQNVRSPPSSHNQVAIVIGSTIGSVVLLLVVTIGIIMYVHVVNKQKGDAEMEDEYFDQVSGMPNRLSYQELVTATENFSKKLGEGGFGSVFEGSLKDGSKIAVKCLEGLSHINKSFLAEVQSIGNIHHVNLVRLRGFCTWKSRRFLVYDFMINGSLDRWIYNGVREQVLGWDCRKKIILDIAKGLGYLNIKVHIFHFQ